MNWFLWFNIRITLVPQQYVWISIQTDSGVTLGEIGRLSSSTDSKIIGATLMALKDIVSSEAAASESTFMEGNVENASFGTISIMFAEVTLVMTYIVSNDSGVVDPETKYIAQELSTNLAKQLIQMLDLVKYAKLGKQIPKLTITRAYINTCAIVRMSVSLPANKKQLLKEFDAELTKILSNRKELLQLIDNLFNTKGWKIVQKNWNAGFLVREKREELLQKLTLHLLTQIILKDPLVVLFVDHKQSIIADLVRTIKRTLNNRIQHPEEGIIKELPKIIKSSTQDIQANIKLRDVHNTYDILFEQYTKKATLKALKNDASLIFVDIPRYKISNTIKKELSELKELKIQHIGKFYIEALKNDMNPSSLELVDAFFEGFFEGLYGVPLTDVAWNLLNTFITQLVEPRLLKDRIEELNTINPMWQSEMIKNVSDKKVNQLKVESINEAALLTNAGNYAIAKTLYRMIENQFLGDPTFAPLKLGYTVDYFIELYSSIGPTVKYSTIMFDLLKYLRGTKLGHEFLTPVAVDFITVAINKNFVKVQYKDLNITYSKKGMKVENEYVPIYDFLTTYQRIKILKDSEILQVGTTMMSEKIFELFVYNTDAFVAAIVNSGMRKIDVEIEEKLNDWWIAVKEKFDVLMNLLNKKNVDLVEFNTIDLNFYTHEFLENNTYSEYVVDTFTTLQDFLVQQITDFDKTLKRLQKKYSQKSQMDDTDKQYLTKQIKKYAAVCAKKVREDKKIITTLRKEVTKTVKDMKKDIRTIINNAADQIMNFSLAYDEIMAPKQDVMHKIQELITGSSLFNGSSRNQLLTGIALEIFNNPTDLALEPAYNEIIQNKLSPRTKEILADATDKSHFERLLQRRAYKTIDDMYDGIHKIIAYSENKYLDQNAPVIMDTTGIKFRVGSLSVHSFTNQAFLMSAFSFPGINIVRETNQWIITYNFPELPYPAVGESNVITLSDAVRYMTILKFKNNTEKVITAIQKVSNLIAPSTDTSIQRMITNIYHVLYAKYHE